MTYRFRILAAAACLAAATLSQSASAAALDRPFRGPDGRFQISAARAAALRECNARAAPYPEYDWGNLGSYLYRTCMFEHGQIE